MPRACIYEAVLPAREGCLQKSFVSSTSGDNEATKMRSVVWIDQKSAKIIETRKPLTYC